MSRTVHTDPRRLRAKRRLAAPHAARRTAAQARRFRARRLWKEQGYHPAREAGPLHPTRYESGEQLPRIVRSVPAPGMLHPAEPPQITGYLQQLAPDLTWGLQVIELRRPPQIGTGALLFGRYQPLGRIVLFAQPRPPWRLLGTVRPQARDAFERAGATVQTLGPLSVVNWPHETLQAFMLSQVLSHELAHHVLQHERRSAFRRLRTSDHERAAGRRVQRRHGDEYGLSVA